MLLSICALDDDESILYTLEAMASTQKWNFRGTTNINECLDWVREGSVEILLLVPGAAIRGPEPRHDVQQAPDFPGVVIPGGGVQSWGGWIGGVHRPVHLVSIIYIM